MRRGLAAGRSCYFKSQKIPMALSTALALQVTVPLPRTPGPFPEGSSKSLPADTSGATGQRGPGSSQAAEVRPPSWPDRHGGVQARPPSLGSVCP